MGRLLLQCAFKKPLKRSKSLAAATTKPSGRQRSSIAACPLPAHSPLLLGHSSLPFARLQTLKTLKTLKTLQPPRGSFHQALWPSPFAVPALQPVYLSIYLSSVCLSICLSIYLSLSLSPPLYRTPRMGGGRRHQGASPFYL